MVLDIKHKHDIQLIKVEYVNRLDKLIIVYKDIVTGEKSQKIISEPEIDYYFNPTNKEDSNRLNYMPIDQLEKVTVKYSDIIQFFYFF